MSKRYFLVGFVVLATLAGGALVWYQRHTAARHQSIAAITVVTEDQFGLLRDAGQIEALKTYFSHGYTLYLCEDTAHDKYFIALIAHSGDDADEIIRDLHTDSDILSQFNEIGYPTPRGGLIWVPLKYNPAWEKRG